MQQLEVLLSGDRKVTSSKWQHSIWGNMLTEAAAGHNGLNTSVQAGFKNLQIERDKYNYNHVLRSDRHIMWKILTFVRNYRIFF